MKSTSFYFVNQTVFFIGYSINTVHTLNSDIIITDRPNSILKSAACFTDHLKIKNVFGFIDRIFDRNRVHEIFDYGFMDDNKRIVFKAAALPQ